MRRMKKGGRHKARMKGKGKGIVSTMMENPMGAMRRGRGRKRGR